jgi:hypothetical protein
VNERLDMNVKKKRMAWVFLLSCFVAGESLFFRAAAAIKNKNKNISLRLVCQWHIPRPNGFDVRIINKIPLAKEK